LLCKVAENILEARPLERKILDKIIMKEVSDDVENKCEDLVLVADFPGVHVDVFLNKPVKEVVFFSMAHTFDSFTVGQVR